MRDAAPQPASNQTPAPRRKSKRRNRRGPKVECLICHRYFKEITAEHLREHGFTLTRYRRAYLGRTRAPRTPSALQAASQAGSSGFDRQTVGDLASRIVSDPEVIRELAGEVSEAIFGSSLRDALRLSLVSVVTERLRAHGEAVHALAQVRKELSEPWRTQQGGPNGGPTPTKDLIAMAQTLHAEVKTGEEVLLKTVKLAIEEYRSNKGAGTVEGGLPDRFTGNAEALPVPAELTAQDRESIRMLWGMFDRAVDAGRDVPVPAAVSDPLPPEGEPPADCLPPDDPQEVAAEVEEDTGSDAEPNDPTPSEPDDPLAGF